ncbi:hypothetical protein C4K31_4999 [Pseudomonas chlororaphis subsp. piscium]|nr:hypothetical protein C4K32_5008 [Pseudomonas chlororaphis subsp. piscium]AZC77879.1 hypothetical protein C4K31_4999 [Pseudomonas chlororaphis subsp. piscium]AZC91515.1 hypothetical protein C4K29_5237 [Pseudomonas chlororaphis subsp. piscium]
MPRTCSFLHPCGSELHPLVQSLLYFSQSMEGLGGTRFVPLPEAPSVWKKQRPTVS